MTLDIDLVCLNEILLGKPRHDVSFLHLKFTLDKSFKLMPINVSLARLARHAFNLVRSVSVIDRLAAVPQQIQPVEQRGDALKYIEQIRQR